MKKLNIKLLSLTWVVWVSLMIFWSAFAFQWDPLKKNLNFKDIERHEQVTTMFANQDYEAFKILFEWKEMLNKINTKEKFEKFTKLHEAKNSWDIEIIKELSKELWLWQRNMDWKWNKNWKKMRWENRKKNMNTSKTEAIENNDYEAFKNSIEWRSNEILINTKEKFEKLVKLHEAKNSWDIETAKKLSEELWLGQRKMNWNWEGKRQKWRRNQRIWK